MARDYTALPDEYLDEMSDLSDVEYGRLIRALQEYNRSGKPIELTGNERFFAKRCMNRNDRYVKAFEEADSKRRDRASSAAKARWDRMHEHAHACTSSAKDAIACSSNAYDAQACSSITSIAYDANTKAKANTETKTKTNTKANYPPPPPEESLMGETAPTHGQTGGRGGEDMGNQEFAGVMRHFLDVINPNPSPMIGQALAEYTRILSGDVVAHAIDVARDNGKYTWSYIEAILQRYTREGITSMAAIAASEAQHRAAKEAQHGTARNSAGGSSAQNRFSWLDDETS